MGHIKLGSNIRIVLIILFIAALAITAAILIPQSGLFGSLFFSVEVVVLIISIIVSLVLALRQLRESTKIARATFITNLNKAFVENKEYTEIYNALQSCLDKECESQPKCDRPDDSSVDCKLSYPKGQVSNYLTFFETIYILYKSGVISFAIIDDLFAYRFFLAVHSKFIQQKKLKLQPQNFKNIFCLEYEWLRWRKDNKKDADPAVDSVYSRLHLKDLIEKEKYEELTKECRRSFR